jgi:predicted nuclease of predicted toxin-antitoxin system
MKIYVDENVPLKITRYLRAEGHEVEYVTRSVGDKDILETAYKQKALLITSDKDFERLVLDELRPTAGVVLLRIPTRVPMEDRAKVVANMLRVYQEKLWGTFTTLTERAVDIRRPLR